MADEDGPPGACCTEPREPRLFCLNRTPRLAQAGTNQCVSRQSARVVLFVLTLFSAATVSAQDIADTAGSPPRSTEESGEETRDEAATADDRQSGSLDDATGSLERAEEDVRRPGGFDVDADVRVAYVRSEQDRRDGSSSTDSSWRGRFRVSGDTALNSWLRFGARASMLCRSDACNLGADLDRSIDTTSSVEGGTITFDEFYLHAFRLERFDVAVGRIQTKFVARAGVFAKSLDRNDSHNTNVNWTDGVHGTLHLKNESIVHLVTEYNDEDGPSNVRRGPLDFSDSGARVSHFLAWESKRRLGPFTQRGLDITYLPSALQKDGSADGRIEDYIGIVGRFAATRPFGTTGRRWNIAGEIGYAPETPTRSSLRLEGDGDADGLAWSIAASLMDIWPDHNIGLNYGRADAGWLISPQYRDNEQLYEVRYQWRPRNKLALEARVRYREELDPLVGEVRLRDEVDFFARLTFGFSR